MHTRGLSKKLAKEKEMEENRGEEEEGIPIEEVETAITTTEPTQDEEMEPQAGYREEASGGMDLQKLWELINENFKKQKEENKEQNEVLKETLKKQLSENIDTLNAKIESNNETLKQQINKNNETLQQRLTEDIKRKNEELKDQLKRDHEKNKRVVRINLCGT